jgi:Ulp1 family protease
MSSHSLDYLVIPIHRPGHWTIAFVDISKQLLVAYDSMEDREKSKVEFNVIKCYLFFIDKLRGYCGFFENFHGMVDSSFPVQNDSISCGVYSLLFIRHKVLFEQFEMTHSIKKIRNRMMLEILKERLKEDSKNHEESIEP